VPLVGLRLLPSTKALLWILPTALLLAACTAVPTAGEAGARQAPGLFPVSPASEQGAHIADLYPIVFAIAVGVFLLVEGLLLWIVFRYRRRPTDDVLPPQTHGNNLLEIIWTAIPAAIVTGLFVMTINTLAAVEAVEEEPSGVVIDVTGFQWQWTFDYANEGLSFTGSGREGPVMALPIDETVRIRLHAQDVVHSFYVPQFLYKKDAVPGRVNEFDVLVRQPGTYTGQCAEFCGLAHNEMYFSVEAMSRSDYDAWVAEQQRSGPTETPPPDAQTLTLASIDSFTFEPAELSAEPDKPIVFEFDNPDQEQPHNVAIQEANPDGSDWNGLPIAQPGQSATYVAPPLPAGTYEFYCVVHPTTMRGTLTVAN
jgi:cytochrome c oxidase subunit II